jgi:uncharacterized protein
MPETQNLIKTNDTENENPNEIEEKNILSTLVDEFEHIFGPALKEIEVKDVRIGLAYTAVLLSEGYGGVACTPLYEFSCCPVMDFPDILKGKPTDKILELTLSGNPLEAAVGVATINALSNMLQDLRPDNFPASDIDVLDLIKPEDSVSMVGYFGPLIPKILEITDKITILEKRDIEDAKARVLPSERAGEILPISDLIILSASTLANRTFDGLLALRGAAREVILLGPSAPLYPGPFFERGVTAVMGTRILDPLTMLTIVSEAGGTKKLQKCCGRKVAFQNRNKNKSH